PDLHRWATSARGSEPIMERVLVCQVGRRHSRCADDRIPRRAVARYRRQPSYGRREGDRKVPAFELRNTGYPSNGGRFEGLHQAVDDQGYADHCARYGTSGLYLPGKRTRRPAPALKDRVEMDFVLPRATRQV